MSPESLGVGQYQHDIPKTKLELELNQVVQHCVSNIGVDINVADVYLLSKVNGLNKTRANAIIQYRY